MINPSFGKSYLICSIFLINSVFIFSQTRLNNKYSKCTEALDNGACKTYTFNKNGTFQDDFSGGFSYYNNGSGHYKILKDSLILNYDTSELRTNDYHKASLYINTQDSIKVSIKVYDHRNNVQSNTAVILLPERILKRTDENGEVVFKLKKEEVQLKFNVTNDFLGYEFSIWKNKNYEIEVFINPYATGIPTKDQIESYKILEYTDEYLILKNNKLTIKYTKEE